MKLSDYIATFLANKHVTCLFGYQGGSITHLIDSFCTTGNISYVQNYNEQASALCADAYARITQSVGVAIATNGPGATNLITGIANAYFDSVPVLFFTGQVHSYMIKTDPNIRQNSFQEADIVSMVSTITKFCATVKKGTDIRFLLEKAWFLSLHERKGPVLLDIPVDIQATQIDPSSLPSFFDSQEYKQYVTIDKNGQKLFLDNIFSLLQKAKRPIVLAGGGINSDDTRRMFNSFVNALKIPTVVSLQGLDTIAHTHECFVGFIGSYGNRYANLAVANADLLLVLGSRLDIRQTGKQSELFAKNASVVHVDIDEYELGHFIHEDISVKMDLRDFFIASLPYVAEHKADYTKWRSLINSWKITYDSVAENISDHNTINPNEIVHRIGEWLPDNTIICSDVGQNQMWVAQSLRISKANFRILNSGGLGTMGFALPASIGAFYASPHSSIFCFCGDGGIQMNIQELQLVGSLKLPITIILLNNKSLGLIRDIHDKYYDGRCFGSVKGFSSPDYGQIAKVYGIDYVKINDVEDLSNSLFEKPRVSPLFLEVVLSEKTFVRPEPGLNRSFEDQFPFISSEEMEKIKSESNCI